MFWVGGKNKSFWFKMYKKIRNKIRMSKGIAPLKIFKKKLEGFTLMELMIALGIFVIVIIVVVSIFIHSVKINRTISKRIAAIDNVSLVVEQIAREIRTGVRFGQLDGLGTGQIRNIDGKFGDGFSFVNYKGETVNYQLDDGVIKKRVKLGDNMIHDFLPITSANVKINRLIFLSSFQPPRITIVVEASGGPFAKPLNLQTTVGARLIYYKKAR